jgi:hypothetical protein
MKKDEMMSVLAIGGADPRVMDAMAEAYDMGLEYGVKGFKHLTSAIETARDVCKYLDADQIDDAKGHTQFFWEHLDKLKEME